MSKIFCLYQIFDINLQYQIGTNGINEDVPRLE